MTGRKPREAGPDPRLDLPSGTREAGPTGRKPREAGPDPAAPLDAPRPFDAAFLADCPYDPEVLLFDALVAVDRVESRVVCRWPTHDAMPFTRSQRAHPTRHPRHVAGALMVHATGMLGFVHAYHVLDLRHADGWVGYGTHMHSAVFRKLVPPGEPIICECRAVKKRLGRARHFIRYRFDFRHQGELCYEGEQSAVWMKVDGADDALPAATPDAP